MCLPSEFERILVSPSLKRKGDRGLGYKGKVKPQSGQVWLVGSSL